MAPRVKPIRFTLAERLKLIEVLNNYEVAGDKAHTKLKASCLAKLEEAVEDAPAGIAAGPMEALMMAHARGKVVKMVTGAAYARATQLLTKLQATEQDMQDLGQWLSRQGWLTGSMTMVSVLGKWDEWLPRARAEAVPKGMPGFGGEDLRPVSSGERTPTAPGRRPTL